MKQKKLLKIYTRTTAREILKINIKKCIKQGSLNKLQRARKIYTILGNYRNLIIPRHKNGYFPINYFINFLSAIPNQLYNTKPIFYYSDNKWDALGLLGERVHKSTIRTKYLQICFETVGLNIARVLDNEVEMFYKYKTEKKRFLAALYYILEKLQEEDLIKILTRANKLSDEKKKINIK